MRKSACTIAIIVCAFVMSALPAWAAAVPPAVAAVQKRYAGLTSMKAEFAQVLTHKQNGRVEKRTGVFYFAKPQKIRWETKTPVPELQLVTQEAIWNIFPDEDMAFKYAPQIPQELRHLVDLLTGQSQLAKEFDIESQGAVNGLAKLALYPKGDNAKSMTMAELHVEPKTGEIRYVGITDLFHNRNDITFTSQALNAQMPETLFSFTPPKTMKVEDKTKSGATGKPLMQ